ncbi:hypothetical protein HFRIS_004993 [Herbaspirillum frisingense GSF30]|uniref:Uncharacterized protein n=1 Tax=Herbaspirillum frisingense GSF30 TaxID=864073 RepID=A0AAI9IGM8_9BURK|nr:hypothetical protein [Herbaspirillum frisingense]EOA05787.1 hypothetical protein HFRIS_004993 [Herbaspirillum frisingense GSF30]
MRNISILLSREQIERCVLALKDGAVAFEVLRDECRAHGLQITAQGWSEKAERYRGTAAVLIAELDHAA